MRKRLACLVEFEMGDTVIVSEVSSDNGEVVVDGGCGNKQIVVVFGVNQGFALRSCTELAANSGKVSSLRCPGICVLLLPHLSIQLFYLHDLSSFLGPLYTATVLFSRFSSRGVLVASTSSAIRASSGMLVISIGVGSVILRRVYHITACLQQAFLLEAVLPKCPRIWRKEYFLSDHENRA